MDSARRPVEHNEALPIPIPLDDGQDSIEDDMSGDEGAMVAFADRLQIEITYYKVGMSSLIYSPKDI